MTENLMLKMLVDIIASLGQAHKWLKQSLEKCQHINLSDQLKLENHESLEALCARFRRANDIVLLKMYRALDNVEYDDGPITLIVTLSRAEKRGILESSSAMRNMRELRNKISHQYDADDLVNIYQDTIKTTPELLKMIDAALGYARKLLDSQGGN